jgi:hypothetical protein
MRSMSAVALLGVLVAGVPGPAAGQVAPPDLRPSLPVTEPVPIPLVVPHGPPPVPLPLAQPEGLPPVPMPHAQPPQPHPLLVLR